jgi:hypothetical protein
MKTILDLLEVLKYYLKKNDIKNATIILNSITQKINKLNGK